jgi:hypothetical protein
MEPAPRDEKIERFLRPFVEDSTLWPVSLVVLAHAVVFTAALVLFAVRDRQLWALLGLAVLLALTGEWVYRDLRRGRLGVASGAIALCWGLAALVAWAASASGLV